MVDLLKCDIVTPERLEFSGEVELVNVPGEMGDFGVMAKHASLVSLIKPGVVSVRLADGKSQDFFVEAGLTEVNAESCTILAERATKVADLSQENVDAARKFGHTEMAEALELAIASRK